MTKLIVIQPTSFCNINCSYCYLPNRQVKGVMSDNVLENTIKRVLNSKKIVDENPNFIWHAGEPMVAGINFYQKAVQLINENNIYNRKVIQSIQTNATLINDEWCNFFLENNINVGVSIDGFKELHDKYRRTRDNKGTFDKVMHGIKLLKKHNISLGGLFVVTYDSLSKAEEIFNFFLDQGFRQVGFNVESIIGSNKDTTISATQRKDTLQKYEKFVNTLYDLWNKNKDKITIREFDVLSEIFDGKLKSSKYQYMPLEANEYDIITISKDGHISTNCPELADGYEGNPSAFQIGNINFINSIDDIEHITKRKEIYNQICEGIEMCKKTCAYFDYCGGASPSLKMYEHKTFLATETSACILSKKVLINVVVEKISQAS